ncbi:hypothetical protein Ddye_028934 [Dipteronia dyeriana]|uniref:Uncharacterized protein n=1 Tax=Dipteronia dyeriana TaxID=168575 RepID=A0AAD9WL14_9ROSI|nr:hypothetical protein Ddye_028934 [Dipteronia dyeriana]
MIRPVTSEDDIPIHNFEADVSSIYTDKINGHFIWDIDPDMCDTDCECRLCSKVIRSSCKPLSHTRKPKDPDSPWIGLHHVKKKPLPIYDRALKILKSEGLLPKETEKPFLPLSAPIPCFMTSSYDKDFPPLEPASNPERDLFSRPFVQSTEVLPDGSLKQLSQVEQVLNWHSHNIRVQNRVLHSIDQNIDQVTYHFSQHDLHLQHLDSSLRNMYTDLQSIVARLDADLHHYIHQGYFGPEFDNKEREIRQLKEQLDQKKKQPVSKPYKHTFYTSRQPTSSSEETSSVEATSIPSEFHSSWETNASSSSDQSYPSNNLSNSNALADLSRVFMASQTDHQPSTQTVDTIESSDETSDETTPIVKEPPDRHSPAPTPKPTNGPWFNLEDSAPHL